jgi:hypothetical protein
MPCERKMATEAGDESNRDELLSKPLDEHGEKRDVSQNQSRHFRWIHVTVPRRATDITDAQFIAPKAFHAEDASRATDGFGIQYHRGVRHSCRD